MKPSAILTADWHIRNTIPSCRKDDFIRAQWKKVEYVFSLAGKYNCPILIAGDLGNVPEWKNESLTRFIDLYKIYHPTIIVVAGQHDLSYHRLKDIAKGGIGVLEKAGAIFILDKGVHTQFLRTVRCNGFQLDSCSFGEEIEKRNLKETDARKVLLVHKMVIKDKDLYPGQNADSAISILKKNPDYDLIVCGDNHQSFFQSYEKRILVNCGSLMRDDIGQKDYLPGVWLWCAKDNSIERVVLPYSQDVFKKENETKTIDANLNSYIKKLQKEYAQGMSFQKNLESFLRQNKIEKNVCDKIWKSLGEK